MLDTPPSGHTPRPLKLLLLAGEASGDNLGGSLMEALSSLCPDYSAVGVGGEAMVRQGLKPLAPMDVLSIMGFSGVFTSIPKLYRLRRTILQHLKDGAYTGVVSIDAPAFAFWLAPAIHRLGIPHIHYVAPTVWAWKANRAKKIARYLTSLLCLFPFEPPYFTPHGLAAPFVGHPVVEKFFPPAPTTTRGGLCLLPGSRRGEITTHLPIFLAAAQQYLASTQAGGEDYRVLIPTLPAHLDLVRQLVTAFQTEMGDKAPFPVIIYDDPTQHRVAMQSASLALAASGTVTLELACTLTPMVVAYKTTWLNGMIARRFLKIQHVSLVNILLNRAAVPECLQALCRPSILAETMIKTAQDAASQVALLRRIPHLLTPKDGKNPSLAAAEEIVARWGGTGKTGGTP